LDEVKPNSLESLTPSIAWASSADRYQALWILDGDYDVNDVESLNRDMAYATGADKSGWDITQVLRVPGSANYKYDPPQEGRVLWAKKRVFSFNRLKQSLAGAHTESATTSSAESASLEDVLEAWGVPTRAKELLLLIDESEVKTGERSDRLWEIETLLLESGMPIMDVVSIIQNSPWNKFRGRRDESAQILREVMKADAHVKNKERSATSLVTTDPDAERLKQQAWAVPYSEFAAKNIEKPQWLVEGIWQDKTYGLIAGEPKTYKSVQATDLAISVASGRAYLGVFPVLKTGPVLYIQEENNEQTVQDRVLKIAHAKGLLTPSHTGGVSLPDDMPLFFSNNYGVDLTQKDSRVLIEETIMAIRPILMILDPLYMMLGQADENSAKEVGEVLRWLTYLRNQYELSILICHHYNKGGQSSRGGQRVRGSSAFHAWVESALYVKATSQSGTVKVEREFRAFPSTPELEISIEMGDPGELHYVVKVDDEMDDRSYGLKQEEICSILSTWPRTMEESRVLAGISRSEARRLLTELEQDGLVVKDGPEKGGRGKKVRYHLTTGGREVVPD